MKLNIANPQRGLQKMFEISKIQALKFCDKKIGDIFQGELISEDFKGFTLRITGGDDHQGFPMKRDLNTNKRLRLLLKKGDTGYRCRRKGCRKRKSVRGCVVSEEISVLSCIVLVEGPTTIPGLTDSVVEQSHLPKRYNKVKKMFGIRDNEDCEAIVKQIVTQAAKEAGKKVPKVRLTRVPSAEKDKKKRDYIEMKKRRKQTFEQEKNQYCRKYGPIKSNKTV
ncbi:hypothetical protein EDEG_00085 [Edhazardia aedis USNM 41457]|uniref:40S ribosomal protein S6 n=1 Tax=Edhazardia aedis (strain USNM 41457) TaxID=1003232 RepID=J8ZZ55_EDHAE|nr:hypothetical protein EDEG_00085 [Edhazardia aedis USNM 41457]|eukprot:EJW04968.1 hypothetical protein EDEG_00085 [Edhazardia aedis USNM 41457]